MAGSSNPATRRWRRSSRSMAMPCLTRREGRGMTVKAEAAPYIDAYRAQPRRAEPRWLAERREAALRNFGDKGFPTRRQEAWRFTDLRPLQRATLPPAAGGAVAPQALDAYRLTGAAHRLVFV